jgi:anthranilate synthase component I
MTPLTFMKKEKLADTETPVSAYLKLCPNGGESFLLESVETKAVTGRYSIVGFDPIFGMELSKDRGVSWNGAGAQDFDPTSFFDVIRSFGKEFVCEPASDLPTVGSLVGFVGYDAVRLLERLAPAQPSPLPTARLSFPSRFVVFDHLRRVMTLAAIDADAGVCSDKISDMEARLAGTTVTKVRGSSLTVIRPSKERFCGMVSKAQEYIRAGDIFQVVLSDSFHGETDLSPFETYRRLRVFSPSPYMFYLNHGEFQIVGASPETLVKVNDGRVTTVPIAGTRGRSTDPEKDRRLEEELLASEKESAEHLMLVDLARNDVGRVSRFGTVETAPFRSVVKYSHVMHIVSEVHGDLREDADAVDAFRACFPAGTVSGAPKVRAMEIIDELEGDSRGPYAGAVGYFGPNGALDLCIAIRMAVFHHGRFDVRVGAGIVADSIPELEYKEIQNKAGQTLSALEATAKG